MIEYVSTSPTAGPWLMWTRIGPVFLYWSEWCHEATVGPAQGAWGGDDLFHCDTCPDWAGSRDEAVAHASSHSFAVSPV